MYIYMLLRIVLSYPLFACSNAFFYPFSLTFTFFSLPLKQIGQARFRFLSQDLPGREDGRNGSAKAGRRMFDLSD